MTSQLRTITVRELRDLLEDQDDNALVIFTANYGDYHRTSQALPLKGEVEEGTVAKSAYSNSGFELVQDDEDPDNEGECADCGSIDDEPHTKDCSRAQKYLVIR